MWTHASLQSVTCLTAVLRREHCQAVAVRCEDMQILLVVTLHVSWQEQDQMT